MRDTDIDVIGLRSHNSEDVSSSPVLPEVLTRLSPRLSSGTVNSVYETVHNLVMSAPRLPASFVTEYMPRVVLEVMPTITRSETGHRLIQP